MIDICNFAQESQSFIRVIETWKEKMKSSFDFFSVAAKQIECILRTVWICARAGDLAQVVV